MHDYLLVEELGEAVEALKIGEARELKGAKTC
jgi:NTP pyrophosphatase (non-canonical NTP hydrolase)